MGSDVQDTLITVLSEKMLPIPELNSAVYATARLQRHRHRQQPRQGRQRTVLGAEAPLQRGGAAAAQRHRGGSARSSRSASPRWRAALDLPVAEERRRRDRAACSPSSASCATGSTADGKVTLKTPSGSLSTAEAIATMVGGLSRGRRGSTAASCRRDGLAPNIVGAIVKDPVQDKAVLEEYLETVLKKRPDYAAYYKASERRALIDAEAGQDLLFRHPPPRAGLCRQPGEGARRAAAGRRADRRAGGCLAHCCRCWPSPAMRPPVALLCYPEDDPAATSFWPFAEFSPEYQAVLLGGAATARRSRFIDLPSSERSACVQSPRPPEASAGARNEARRPMRRRRESPRPKHGISAERRCRRAARIRDLIGTLARAAGYEDGESWWSDVIEQNPAPGPIFAAIADAMTALREEREPVLPDASRPNARRICGRRSPAAGKEFDGPIAVICGAWHVPALKIGCLAGKMTRRCSRACRARRAP